MFWGVVRVVDDLVVVEWSVLEIETIKTLKHLSVEEKDRLRES